MTRSIRMSFCLRAATTLEPQDLDVLTDAIEAYTTVGMDTKQAELLAVEDVLTRVKTDRSEVFGLVVEQHGEALSPMEQPVLNAPTRADIEDMQASTEQAGKSDQREQVKRESEAAGGSRGVEADGVNTSKPAPKPDTPERAQKSAESEQVAKPEAKPTTATKSDGETSWSEMTPAQRSKLSIPESIKSQKWDALTVDQQSIVLEAMGQSDQLSVAEGQATTTTYTKASETQQTAAKAFAERLSRNKDSYVIMDAVEPSGPRKKEAETIAKMAKTMFGREVVFVKFQSKPLFNGAVSTTDLGKVFLNIETARPMMAVLGHELLHELRKSNPAAYKVLANNLKNVTKDDFIYEALLKKKYANQGLNWVPQDISEELYGDIVGDNFMDPKFWEAIAGDKPILAKQLYRAVMNWLDKIASMFKRMKVRQDGNVALTLAEQADGSRPFGTQKYLTDIEAARAAVAEAMGQFGKAKGGKDSLSVSDKPAQTDTPAFKKWFEGSKVVDKDGAPLVVYHGTIVRPTRDGTMMGDIAAFDRLFTTKFRKPSIDTMGSWFSDNSGEGGAQMYAGGGATPGAAIYPVYLSIKNPQITTFQLMTRRARLLQNGKDDGRMIGQAEVDAYRKWLSDTGKDGIKIEGSGNDDSTEFDNQTAWIAINPEQIKSAIGNNGNFDGTNADIRLSVADGAWDQPTASRFDDFTYKAQDKLIDLKRVTEAITKKSGAIADGLNTYLQEELFHGRSAKRVEDFASQELEPLMKAIAERGMTIADVEEYLHARHAPEANKVIAERNPDTPGLQDGGSGMTNAAAEDYMAKLTFGQKAKLSTIAKKVDAIVAKTRQEYVDSGLEDQKTVDGWDSMFKHYIPLQREDKGQGMGIGQGFSVKGRETKGRTGSTRKVVDILANLALQRERLIVRGEKNRVAQSLIGLALANPNAEFWEVRSQPPTERVYDAKTNKVVDRPDSMFKNRPNVLAAKVKDNKGNVTEQAIVFNEDDPRALRLAATMKNLDVGSLEGLLGVSAKITRYFSAINTQYNPVFGVVNLVRDVQGALINLGETPLSNKRVQIAKDTGKALAGIYSDQRKTRKGGQANSKWSALWEEFQEVGGKTGYRDLFKDSKDRAKKLEGIINPDAWMDSKLGKVFTANGTLRVPVSEAKKKADWLFGWLSDYNEAMENGVRLAAYKAGIDQGMSKEQSASLARNLTVNFNRKGQIGQQAGALYAFFNAAMQGSAKIGQTLFTMEGGDLKTLGLTKTGKAVIYGGITLGAMQALALAGAGFDDDDPPKFLRERSLIIPTGGKTYIAIPMPLGYHVIPGIGRNIAEFALSGFDKPAERAIDMIGMFADAFNPIGNSGLSMQTIAPTALDPFVALSENRDWTGRPIARTSFNKATPGHTLRKDTASTLAKFLSEGINTATGGNEYVAGALSPTPDQIDYLIGQVTGGVGREYSKIEQSTLATVQGEDLPTYKIPLVGRFVGNSEGQSSEGSAFYSSTAKLNELETEIKGLRADGRSEEANKIRQDNPETSLILLANATERRIQKMRKEKRKLIEDDAPRESVRDVETRITETMARFNRAMERVDTRQ